VLRTRLTTAAIVLPIVLAMIVWASATGFAIFIGVVAAWGLYEIGEMSAASASRWAMIVLCGALPALSLLIHAGGPWLAPAAVIVALSALTFVVGLNGPGQVGVWRKSPSTVILGALGVGVLFPYFAFLRNGPRGIATLILMLLMAVASDSGAYFAGRAYGRIKLLPRVSPHKTVEGAAGGLGASVIAGLVLRPILLPALGVREVIVLGAIVAVLAQVGDLANSAFKRVAGAKDSGWIFPGHGGLLDRTCSLVFPAVFTYYYLY
jgi:phosphatidate cytidylyltransferase